MVKIEIAKPEKAETLRANYLIDQIQDLTERMNKSLESIMVANDTVKYEYSLKKGISIFDWAIDAVTLHLAEAFQTAGWVAKVEYQNAGASLSNSEHWYEVTLNLSSPKNSSPYR